MTPATGKMLDHLAELQGLRRKRWFWIFRERDVTLRKRLLAFFRMEGARIKKEGEEAWARSLRPCTCGEQPISLCPRHWECATVIRDV